MKSLIYKTLVESEEDLLARVMAMVDVGLPGIGDCVYQNTVCRYRVCVEVSVIKLLSPSCKWTQKKNIQ